MPATPPAAAPDAVLAPRRGRRGHHVASMRSRDQALAAVRAFHAEHGRLPRWREWERATASRPCAKTIDRRWGWRELLAEAVGVRPAGDRGLVGSGARRPGQEDAGGAQGRTGRARPVADRRGVGSERPLAIVEDVRSALR